MRSAGRGDWGSAIVRLGALDPERARRWTASKQLSSDESPPGLLQWARFLKTQNGKIFYGLDTAWHRSLNHRLAQLRAPRSRAVELGPWSREEEVSSIEGHLLGSSEMWSALQAYVAYLSTAAPGTESLNVLTEADQCYNWLINYDLENSTFWKDYLEKHEVVLKLRQIGRDLGRSKREELRE